MPSNKWEEALDSEVLIVALNMRQAEFHAREMGLRRNQWRLITSPEQVRGYRNRLYKAVGEYYKLDDWREIEYLLMANDCTDRPDLLKAIGDKANEEN